MNALLYSRVSTTEQADKDLSIPAQLDTMRAYAKQHGWTVVEEFVEPGVSAKTTDRPALQRLLAKVREASGSVDVVLVHKIDRLARNVYDHATIKALLLQHKIRLASVVENVDESVSGQLVENIMASIAQFYSANLSDEVKKGMRQKVLQGGWPHLAPRGYVHVRDDKTHQARVEPHPKEGRLMKEAFERYSTGWHSLKSLAAILAKDGVKAANGQPIAPGYLRQLLGNPFYAGRLRWNGIEVPGGHEPLITQDLFDRVQEVLKRRFKDPGAKGTVNGFPLRGLAICASCRGHMTAGYQRRRWGYYRCCRRGYNRALCSAVKYCPADLAHRAIERVCWQLRLSSSVVESILKAAVRLIDQRTADARAQLTSLRMKRAKLAERELGLTRDFVAGDLSPNDYKNATTILKDELKRLGVDFRTLDQDSAELIAKVETQLKRASTVWELHGQLTDNRQVELLRAVFQTIVLDQTGVVGFTLQPPFDTIFQNAQGTIDRGVQEPARQRGRPDTARLAEDIVRNAIEHDEGPPQRRAA